MCNCPMCLNGMPGFCQGTLSESNQVSQRIGSVHSHIEDGELDEGPEEDERNRGISSRRSASRGSTRGRVATLGDQQSSGRKIAKRLYKIYPDMPCEWQNKANCGGGTSPIIGCIRGIAVDRHHGPDKNVANNERGNVHRICKVCHNKWHAQNDEGYDWNATVYPPHDPREMTKEELEISLLDDLRYHEYLKRRGNKRERADAS